MSKTPKSAKSPGPPNAKKANDTTAKTPKSAKSPGQQRTRKRATTGRHGGTDDLALKDSSLPVATHRGTLNINGIKIPCFVLGDGRRILSGRGVTTALGLRGRSEGMDRFLKAKGLQGYVSEDLRNAIENPIRFSFLGNWKMPKGLTPLGYEAAILPELCNTITDAKEAGTLAPQQEMLAIQAKILTRGFSVVGITSLVDEATGYQEIRPRDFLEKLLEAFIAKELVRWAKRFPDTFYEEMFRLRGWQFSLIASQKPKRPSVVGRYTNDIVYARLAPGVLQELRKKNPVDPVTKRRKERHHQWLTEDIGHPKLAEHLAAVIALMKASTSWDGFMRALNRALPRYNETIDLFPDYFKGIGQG